VARIIRRHSRGRNETTARVRSSLVWATHAPHAQARGDDDGLRPTPRGARLLRPTRRIIFLPFACARNMRGRVCPSTDDREA
jgi:hypothetical protein